MNILVIGCGAVGIGLATFLHRAGCSLTVVAKKPVADSLRANGLCRTGALGEYQIAPEQLQIIESGESVPAGSYQMIVVCTKSYDVGEVARMLHESPGVIGLKTKVLLIQSGLSNYEEMTRYCTAHQVFVGRLYSWFEKEELYKCNIKAHYAPCALGHVTASLAEQIAEFAALLSSSGFQSFVSRSIVQQLWSKQLYDVIVDPLAALFGLSNEALSTAKHTRAIMQLVATEAFAVMQAAGYSLSQKSAYDFISYLHAELIPARSGEIPLMLRDMQQGKRAEIEATLGALLKLASRYGKNVPTLSSLYHQLHLLQQLKGISAT